MKQREENSLRRQTRAKMGDTPLPAGELTGSAISVYISLAVYEKGIALCPCGRAPRSLEPNRRIQKTRDGHETFISPTEKHDRMPRCNVADKRFYKY